ncbi:unnamed protein product [Candidula unifasciata]|uniref:SH2 domain-containing protein n=1 Tax=Candidula unifasciata TaxID=100452 RepID=A0A8S3YU18_9EUPU|nr:unnamed protein product [Candidula unifasciata]
MNLSDPSLPKLPPRPGERSLKPQDSKSNLNDSKNLGSVSSESNTHLQDTKVHPDASGQHLNKKSRVLVFPVMHADIKKTAFQARAEKFEAVIGKKVADEQKAQDSAIYDDGASEMLSSFDWFHGELDREEGAQRVKKLYENGAFLIRASKSDGSNNSHPYTLVVTLDQKVYNLKIRLRHDSRFAIGTYKSDEVSFASVPELVEHHRENNIKLAEGGTVKLHRTPKK